MDLTLLLGPIATGATDAIADAVPLAAPVLVALVGIGIFLGVLRKFGVKR